MLFFSLANMAAALIVSFTISTPLSRTILQRDGGGSASVSLSCTYSSPVVPNAVQVRFVPMPGYSGSATAWTAITYGSGTCSGSPTVPGGWYSMQLRALDGAGNTIGLGSRDRIGVGDIYITAGQSTAANFGQTAIPAGDDRVNSRSVLVAWQLGSDPQPNDGPTGGTAGSPWPNMGNILVAKTQVPVGMIELGIGATAISKWLPTDASNYYHYIHDAVQLFGVNGFKALNWQQGESDTDAGTTQIVYFSSLSTIIAQSRVDAGWSVPWLIAKCTYSGGTVSAAVQAAQAQAVSDLTAVYVGANTDDNIGSGLRYDGTHMTKAGSLLNGLLWGNAVISAFSF